MQADLTTKVLRFRMLKLAYSWKCNAGCRHCAEDSHPQRSEKLAVDRVLQCIDDAAALGFGRIEFTGGEIMLFRRELDVFLEHSHTLGFDVALYTNAFWAKDSNSAQSTLSRLRALGVNSIFLSTDSYHTEYINLEYILRAVDAAHRVGVYCDVTICVVRNDFQALDIISRLRRHCDKIRIQHVGPWGRARNMDRDQMLRCGFQQAGRPCGNMYAPFVTPDGRVSLCCAPPSQFPRSIARASPLILGWLEEERLKNILSRAMDDPLLNIFAAEGLHSLLQRLNVLRPGSYRPRSQGYFGRCDLCTEVFGCPSRVEQIRSTMPRLADVVHLPPAKEAL
jgi:hypothetical protein